MAKTIWSIYQKIKEIDNKNSSITTYLAKIEPIIKEIKPKDESDYIIKYQRLEKLKKEIKVYDIIEEDGKFYVIIDNNEELSKKVDNLILSEELNIRKDSLVEGKDTPIKKNEISELFKMEKSMCKIESITVTNEKRTGSGFFCKLDNCPIKYALFTNNHIIDESNIEFGDKIKIEYFKYKKSAFNSSYDIIKKEIKLTERRRIYTSKELDYTCIELLESDGIKDFFEIDPMLYKYDNNILKNNDIYIYYNFLNLVIYLFLMEKLNYLLIIKLSTMLKLKMEPLDPP